MKTMIMMVVMSMMMKAINNCRDEIAAIIVCLLFELKRCDVIYLLSCTTATLMMH